MTSFPEQVALETPSGCFFYKMPDRHILRELDSPRFSTIIRTYFSFPLKTRQSGLRELSNFGTIQTSALEDGQITSVVLFQWKHMEGI